MAPKRRCPTCGSRQWHKEPSSGLIACSEGHVLQNYRNEATEAEEFGPHALRKRALKKGRKKKENGSKANPSLYHGARGRYHYFECLQLLLRKQIAAVKTLWGLPLEFEVLCRDIWALHLDMLPDPPSAEPYLYAHEVRDEEVGVASEETNKASKSEDKSEDEDEGDQEDEEQSEEGDDSEGEGDPELAALLRANSDLEESSSEESNRNDKGKEAERKPRTKGNGRMRGRYVYESPASTIAILVVGCWTMRIPALYRDFTRLIESYELPYLDPIERQLLPGGMVVHLTKHNIQALSPHHPPSAQALHQLASRLSRMMYTSYGILTPEANAAPILWRVISQGLEGTPMLYKLTKRLGKILSLPLTLHHMLAPGLEKRKTYDPERHIYDNVAPEVGLMGAAIMVLKLVYGLDGRPRTPRDEADVACGFPRLEGYLTGLRKHEGEGSKWNDIWTNNEMMDAYLGFSERVLLGDSKNDDAVLERYFGVSNEGNHGAETSGDVPRRHRATLAGEEGFVPGSGYRVHRARDVGGMLENEYGIVLERAASWTGVSVAYMGGVVESYERRFIRWWDVEKRQSRG